MNLPILSLCTFVPLLGALAIFLMPKPDSARWIALGTTVIVFALSLLMFAVVGWLFRQSIHVQPWDAGLVVRDLSASVAARPPAKTALWVFLAVASSLFVLFVSAYAMRLTVTDWRPLRYLLSVGPIFGRAAARTAASPLTHVSRGMPPFLMAYADSEWFRLGKQAEAFYAAARAAGASVERVIIENRNHVTIMGRAHDVRDPLVRAAAGFFARLGARISA